eukprot:324857_1
MTDYEQEQQDELESLECLYPNTFKRDKDEPNKKFSIEILPHPDSDEPNHIGIKLHVSYPCKYPEETASFRIECIKGLNDKQMQKLSELCITLSNDNIGSPSMFTICTELQEWLIQNNIPSDTSLHDQMKAQKELKARLQRLTFGDEEKTDDHTAADVHAVTDFDQTYQRAKGTPVNKKTFAKWAKKFLKNYRKEQQDAFIKKYGNDDKRDKLTGVQIFEMKAKEKLNLGGNDHELYNEKCDDKNKKKKFKSKKKNKDKTVVIGDIKGKNDIKHDSKTVVISDESLFLDMEMPDI